MTSRTDKDQVFDADGNLVAEKTVVRDTTVETNEESIRDAASNALATNRAYVATVSPTAAATTAQVKALSRQNNGLIRLLLGLLDGTD
jgi:hypothetical protein